MRIKCVAIDDEPLALELIKEYTARFTALELMESFNDAIAAREYLRTNHADLIFIDINMPDITGLELVRSLPERPIVIFTTAYKDFAIDGFELDALDYLLKPIEFSRFSKAVEKAIDYYRYKRSSKTADDEFLFVRSEYRLIKIELKDIEYIESFEDYLKIYLSTGKPLMTLMTLKALLGKLPPERFKRIHRSYVIPLAKVKAIVNRKVRLTTAELPISDSYIASLQGWIKK